MYILNHKTEQVIPNRTQFFVSTQFCLSPLAVKDFMRWNRSKVIQDWIRGKWRGFSKVSYSVSELWVAHDVYVKGFLAKPVNGSWIGNPQHKERAYKGISMDLQQLTAWHGKSGEWRWWDVSEWKFIQSLNMSPSTFGMAFVQDNLCIYLKKLK